MTEINNDLRVKTPFIKDERDRLQSWSKFAKEKGLLNGYQRKVIYEAGKYQNIFIIRLAKLNGALRELEEHFGEEEKDFKATYDLIQNIPFINSYSFIFSPRPGTTASNYKQVDEKLSKERLKQLQTLLFNNQKLKNKSFENKYIDVLVENVMKDKKNLFGRNEYMTSVIFKGNKNLVGKVVSVKIINSNQNSLFGEININETEAA